MPVIIKFCSTIALMFAYSYETAVSNSWEIINRQFENIDRMITHIKRKKYHANRQQIGHGYCKIEIMRIFKI